MACTDVLDEDVLHREGFASARYVDAVEFGQMFEFRAVALGDYRQHCLVILIDLKHKTWTQLIFDKQPKEKWHPQTAQCSERQTQPPSSILIPPSEFLIPKG